jgi:hypothetical protein
MVSSHQFQIQTRIGSGPHLGPRRAPCEEGQFTARARGIKPGFFKNEVLAALSCHARLLFIGLWTLADREGRMEDRPLRIRGEIFPYESVDANFLLKELASAGFILRYEACGQRFLCIPTFKKHQNPHVKEQASTIPAPGMHQTSTEVATLIPSSLIPDSPLPHTSNGRVSGKNGASTMQTPDFEPEFRFQSYMKRHPGVKTRSGDCRSHYIRIVADSPDPVLTAGILDAKQDKWLEYWASSKAPPLGLFNFLASGDCMVDPPESDGIPECMRGVVI